MPKIPSSKSFINNKPKDGAIPIPPIPPFINSMPSPIPSLSNKSMSERLQQFHQQHFSQPSFPMNMFMPFPFHSNETTSVNSTQPQTYQNPEEINYEIGEEEEEYNENAEEIPMSNNNQNDISFVLTKETIEMFRHSELYRQKLKEEREQEEKLRLQKEKEEELKQLKIYQEHNKNYEEHLEIYGDFKLKLMEDALNEEFKKQNTGELWPILPLNE